MGDGLVRELTVDTQGSAMHPCCPWLCLTQLFQSSFPTQEKSRAEGATTPWGNISSPLGLVPGLIVPFPNLQPVSGRPRGSTIRA